MSTREERTLTPSKVMEPREGSSRRQRRSVLLPEPEGPMMNTSSWGRTRRSMPLRTWRSALRAPGRWLVGDVALEAGQAVAGEDGDGGRAGLGLHAEPPLVQAREEAIELHALDDVLDLVAHRHVVLAEGDGPHQAGLDRVGELEPRGL